jgi:hypothetical protein
MICLLADVGLRFLEPDLAFDPFRRLETGFLTGRGFEGVESFGSIPKMPIMGLDESLLGMSFRIKQPAATYRARFRLLPIGLADIAGVWCGYHDILHAQCNAKDEFPVDNKNLPRGLS